MADPIYTNYPETLKALQNKYQEYGPQLAQLPTPIVRSLATFDLQRVQRGQNPLSQRETLQVLQTALTGQAFTPEPEPSIGQTVRNILNPFAGRRNPVISDLATIGSSIPRIPLAVAREMNRVKDLPEILNAATTKADNPLEAIGNLAMSPGLRFIPGSFVAGNLLGGTEYDAQGKALSEGSPGELVRHPLFTGLDVLPYAEGLAKLSPAVKAQAADIAALKEAGTPVYDIPKLKPIRTALTRQVDELGRVVPNRLGERTIPIAEGIGRTKLGQLGQEAFGRKFGRTPAAIKAKYDVDAAERMNPASIRNGPEYQDALTQWNREARSLDQEFSDIPPERIRDLTRRMQLDDLGDVSGRDLEYVNRVKNLVDRSRQFGFETDLLGEATVAGSPEVYPRGVANRITRSQRFVEHATDVSKYRSAEASVSADDTWRDLSAPLYDTAISKKRRLTAVEARAYNLHRQGYNVDPIIEGIGKARIGRMSEDDVARVIADVRRDRPTVGTVISGAADTAEDMAMIVQRLKSLSKADPQVAKLSQAIRSERWTDAAQHLRDIRARTRNVLDDVSIDSDALKEAIKRKRRETNFMRRTEKTYGAERIGELEAYRQHLERTNVPARFRRLTEEATRDKVKEFIPSLAESRTVVGPGGEVMDLPPAIATGDIDEALKLADEGNFSLIHGLDQDTFRQFETEARNSWMEMKAEGLDPVFIHRVTPAQAVQLGYPRILDHELTPSQVKEAITNFEPRVDDATVALEHQGMEWLIKRGSEAFIEEIATRYGVPERVLQEQYLPAARAAAEINPSLDVRAYMQELMKKEWTPYTPKDFITWKNPRIKQFGDDLWVPKPLRKNLERMHIPPSGRLTQAIDPVMRVFRTSLLPLSPRWHIYNILGGGVVTGARTGVGAIPLIGEAWKMAREGSLPEGVMHGYGMVPRDVLQWQATASTADKVGAAFHYLGGSRMRDWWDSAQGAREGFNKFVQKSYDFNGFFDDFYRSISYLYGKTKAERLGLSEEAARTEGIMLTRKVMQNWDEITPLERTVMRYVFPFYGWMNHIMRYVMSYPYDHPYRTAILSQFARNELEDMGTGLPQNFMNMLFVGEPDENGKIKAINTAGMNPFSDVANYFTLAGFTGNVNPVIGAVLQSLGVDTGRGAPTLYPNLTYDPETGRMVAKNDSLVMNFAQAVVPQSRVLFAASGMSSEWKELLRRNPDAAGRMLASQLGVPVLAREVPIYEEMFKNELARSDAQNTEVRDALKQGRDINGYPALDAFMAQIRALQAQGQLADYTPQQQTPGFLEAAQQGIVSALNPR